MVYSIYNINFTNGLNIVYILRWKYVLIAFPEIRMGPLWKICIRCFNEKNEITKISSLTEEDDIKHSTTISDGFRKFISSNNKLNTEFMVIQGNLQKGGCLFLQIHEMIRHLQLK